MSKNLTRKGLALGAIVALSSSLLAGAPAFAGTESAKISLAPNAGTTYTTLIGASFDLKTGIDATVEAAYGDNKNAEELTYLISNPTAQRIKIDLDGAKTGGTAFGRIQWTSGDTADFATAMSATSTSADTVDTADKFIAVTFAGYGTGFQSADTADLGKAKNLARIVTSTDSTEPFSITVQAFLDDNNNGKIDEFEFTSPSRTISFIKAAAATVTTEVTSAVIGSSKLQGKVVLGNDLNQASLASQIQIKFFKNAAVRKMHSGTTAPTTASTTVDTVDVVYDSTNLILKNDAYFPGSVDATDNLTVAAGTYTAKAYFKDFAGNYIALGTESAGVGSYGGSNALAAATSAVTADAAADVIKGNQATTVRTGFTGAVGFSSYVTTIDNTDTTDALKVAGLKVKVTITKGDVFTAGHEITAGGVKLTSTSGPVSFETTTDATGKVVFSATSNKGTKGESYRVDVAALTTTGYATSDYTVVTFTNASIKRLVATNVSSYGGQLAVAKGGSATLNYSVVDNYGTALKLAGTYRVSVAQTGTVTGGASVSGTADVASGKATFAFTDNSITATGNYVLRATLTKLNDAGTAYETATVTDGTLDVTVNVGVAAVSALTVPVDTSAGSELDLESALTFVNHNLLLDGNTKTWSGVAFKSAGFRVNGVATTATGAAAPGALVTISAPSAQFIVRNNGSDDTTALLATESVTVNANSAGEYSVYMLSHSSGDVKITVTSGSVSKVVTAKFKYPAKADKNSKLAISGASTTKAGRSNTYIVTLTDYFGNVVKKSGGESIIIEQSGAGYLVSTPVVVGATSGKAILNLITQPADAGLANITATFDVTAPDADIVVTKNVLVGISAVVAKKATSKVTVKNANGLTVKVVRGTKSVTKEATSDKFAVSLKGGTGSVKVYVEDILVASK